ncbi:TrkH family potassium uptake protein [Oryzobacter sp. R7]|uniref:TrkH family potassium uptake protein n=1 Tax=Oryzobacter faecalis TaxID=3388656 RepID=UPI00398C9912
MRLGSVVLQRSTLTDVFANPIRLVVVAFAAAVGVGTALLMTPVATETGEPADLVTALFTATSAVCVTGLVVVDTSTHWSTAGELVILGLIQVGGLGVMTTASVVALLIGSRLGIRASRLAEVEAQRGSPALGSLQLVRSVVRTALLFEVAVAVVLAVRLATAHGEPPGRAAYLGVFHAVSAFNNAGFALYADSLERFVADPVVCGAVALAIICGGIGFPVLWELRRAWRAPRRWSLHTRITVWGTAALLPLSTVVITAAEWSNDATLGAHPGPVRLLAGFFHATNTRTAGFNSVPVGDLHDESLLASTVLMVIGGGSGGTAGGIKVTTFLLLGFVLWAELRGERRVSVGGRTLPADVQRQALTVALLSVAAVVGSTYALLWMTDLPFGEVLFEAASAFGTVGLSTGITAGLPSGAQLLVAGLMFLGRLGPLTLGAALALRTRPRRVAYPEERPIVG